LIWSDQHLLSFLVTLPNTSRTGASETSRLYSNLFNSFIHTPSTGRIIFELMPSWKIPSLPGYEHPLDVLNDEHLLGQADDGSYIHDSGVDNIPTSINANSNNGNEDKSVVGPEERRFHLSLGLADPRLQQGSQHLGFGSLDADSGSLCEQESWSDTRCG
jgi:hypothetical protein